MFRFVMTLNLLVANCFYKIEKCDIRNTCSYSSEKDLPICYCDEECFKFNDCCQEHVISKNETVQQSDAAFYSCIDVMTGSQTGGVKVGSVMIDRCQGSGSFCNVTVGRLESIVPVSNDRQTFRNSYCASCNGVDNFTYWNLLFEITKRSEISSLDITPQMIGHTVLKLTNEISPKEPYNLYPPDGFSPRYCSAEMFRKGTTIRQDELYQNFAFCEDSLVKNPEQCLLNDSSMSEKVKCVSYDTTYLNTRNMASQKNTAAVSKSLQVLVELGSRTTEADKFTKEGIGDVSFKFMRKRFHLYLVISLEKSAKINDGMQLIEECFLSLIVLLKSTKYVLINEFAKFRVETTDGFKYSTVITVRSMTTLDMSELDHLLNLFLAFQYKDSNANTFAAGYLHAVSSNFTYLKPHAKKYYVSMDLSKIKLSSHDDTISCGNLSLILQTRMPTAVLFDVRCEDKAFENTSRKNHGHVGVLSITMVVVSVVYALLITTDT